MNHYHLKESEWQFIYNNLQKISWIRNSQVSDLRLFIEGVFFILKGGCQWRLLPSVYGKWQTIYRRFIRWNEKGVWSDLFANAIENSDLQEVMLDGTIVRAHACAAGYRKDSGAEQGLGRSKGGFTTKIHALVDALGNPLKFIITGGNRNEIIKAEELVENIENTTVIADKAYDSKKFRDHLEEKNCKHVIPPRRNRKIQYDYDEHVYVERHLIECFFGKLKHFRRVFSRFDKAKSTFQAFIDFAATLISLR